MNKNIPIFIILILFVASNFFLYNYLNHGFFTDKQPLTPKKDISKIIFDLIALNEEAIRKQILENERRIRELNSLELIELDEAAREKVRAELASLEREKQLLLNAEKQSQLDIIEAREKARNTAKTISELQDANTRLGVELEKLKEEFSAYRTGLMDSELLENERIRLGSKFKKGLEDIAQNIEYSDFSNKFSVKEILELTNAIEDINNEIDLYLENAIKTKENNLEAIFANTLAREKQIAARNLNQLEGIKNSEIKNLINQLSNFKNQNLELDNILEVKKSEIVVLEEKLTELLSQEPVVQEIPKEVVKEVVREVSKPSPDNPVNLQWQFIPGLWNQNNNNLSFSGTKVESIAWSKSQVKDNITISYIGDFKSNGEMVLNLYGDGKFKSWKNGLNLIFKNMGQNKSVIEVYKDDISNKGIRLLTKEVNTELNGTHYIIIQNGLLNLSINGIEVVTNYKLDVPQKGHIGFGNKANMGLEFELKNINIFDIK